MLEWNVGMLEWSAFALKQTFNIEKKKYLQLTLIFVSYGFKLLLLNQNNTIAVWLILLGMHKKRFF